MKTVESNSSDSDDGFQQMSVLTEFVGNVKMSYERKQFVTMKVNQLEVHFQIDSGATCNVISTKELKRILGQYDLSVGYPEKL